MVLFRIMLGLLLVLGLWSSNVWATSTPLSDPLAPASTSLHSMEEPEPTPSNRHAFNPSPVVVELLDHANNPIAVGHKQYYPHVLAPSSLQLRLTNTGIDRTLVLVSINGINPLTGDRATRASKGFVLASGQVMVVDGGKASKKGQRSPLLDGHAPEGHIAVGVYVERFDYPTITPEMETVPPFGPENYKWDSKGVKHWIPPSNFPFRKRHQDPSSSVYFTYTTTN